MLADKTFNRNYTLYRKQIEINKTVRSLKHLVLTTLVCFALLPVMEAQGILEEQVKTLFSDEQTVGLNVNSNGIGASYRYARYMDARNRWHYDIELDYVKHPKEYKTTIAIDYYTRRFVYGKANLFWEAKGYIGKHNEIYRKADKSSISVKMFYSGGISIGFQKPIYYDVLYYDTYGRITDSEVTKFDPAIHLYNYGGTASFFQGFDETKVIPGLTLKAGFNFEYSEREPLVHALEAGLGATVYPKSIQIMATDQSNYFFFQMYVGYRFGHIIDISAVGQAKSRKERREERREAMKQSSNRRILNF